MGRNHRERINDAQLVIRAPDALRARAEEVRKQFADDGVEVTLAAVLRMAVERGLDVLEGRFRAPAGQARMTKRK